MIAGERRLLKAANFRGRWYWVGTAGWIAYFVMPIVPGWLIGQIFDALHRGRITTRTWVLFALLALAEALMVWGLALAHWVYVQGIESSKALIRANIVRAQLANGGGIAAPRNVPVGDVLVRMREDPFDTMFLLDNWVDLVGAVLYGSAAAWFLVRIDTWGAVVGIAPLLLCGWANSLVASLARRFRQRARVASSAVSDFLAAAFEASLTVKVAGAQPGVLRRLGELNTRRAKAAVGDHVWNEVMWTLNGTLADVFVGLALVVAARRGLTAGQISQFASYLLGLVWLPMRIGGLIAGRRRYDVSVERLDALVAPPASDSTAGPTSLGHQRRAAPSDRAAGSDPTSPSDPAVDWDLAAPTRSAAGNDPGPTPATVSGLELRERRSPDRLFGYLDLPILGGPSVTPYRPATRRPLDRLEGRGLTIAGRGVSGVDLDIRRGTLTVIAGPVGSGKTSLLRGLLGLIELDAGELRWNGELITDPANFLVPPQCAYVAQVPRLFAESLADNLRLGHAVSDGDLIEAIRLAAFGEDLAGLPDGLATMVGARGVRLSGGQAQRAAGARALAHRPELLVLDDLTSALDVETERVVWDRLAQAGYTVIAASNRPVALARADQEITMASVG